MNQVNKHAAKPVSLHETESIWLMYHDIYQKDPVSSIPRSAAMYHVPKDVFTQHLIAIKASGRRVVTASESLNGSDGDTVILTFDDGWRGAFETALPLLMEFGFKATFFITQDFVGRKGFCDQGLILDAARAGMEVGVHGKTHRMLSSCSPAEIKLELSECKEYLESLLHQPVVSASMPGGDWNEIIASCAKEAGLKTLCTSKPGINNPKVSLFNLRRIAIRDNTSAADIHRYCSYNVRRELLRWSLLQLPRAALGMRQYTLLRRWLLGEQQNMNNELFKP
jgi:peptidoglycan/xylan/chitin deacetylase (PgdA/CDA1 family)